MSGYLFAGVEETPAPKLKGSFLRRFGVTEAKAEKYYKLYRGMGSRSVLTATDRYMGSQKRTAEGIEALVEYKGSARKVLSELEGALRQGFGYVGARNVQELRKNARFGRASYGSKGEDLIVIDSKLFDMLLKSEEI